MRNSNTMNTKALPEGKNQPLNHVVAVLCDSFLTFTSVKQVEKCIIRNALELIDCNVGTFTVYDRKGLVRSNFYDHFGNCSRTPINIDFNESEAWNSCDYLDNIEEDQNLNCDRGSIYYLEKKGSEVFISGYVGQNVGEGLCIRLCFLDKSHAHTRILGAQPGHYELPVKWIERHYEDVERKNFRYRIPNDEHICQPDLQRHVCTIDGTELPTPDLLVSVKLSAWDAIRIFIVNMYIRLLWLASCLFPKLVKPRLPHRIDMYLLFSSALPHVGAMFLRDTQLVYSFGPYGVPPWFLAEAELQQCFGMDSASFKPCINAFFGCQRRNGR